MPVAAYAAFTHQLGATEINSTSALPLNEGPQGLWSVPCANVASFPNLVRSLFPFPPSSSSFLLFLLPSPTQIPEEEPKEKEKMSDQNM